MSIKLAEVETNTLALPLVNSLDPLMKRQIFINGVSLMTQGFNSVFVALSKGTFFSPWQF